jgi:hypothetical protein
VRLRRVLPPLVTVLAIGVLVLPSNAAALQKGFWGPTQLSGYSQFPVYKNLGVDIFQMQLRWELVTPTRPAHPRDPNDPAYRWPSQISYGIQQAKASNIKVALMILFTPQWANGNRPGQWIPNNLKDYSDFAYAASKRYPSVHLWMVWGEPSRVANWQPMTAQPASQANAGKPLTPAQARAPRAYAKMLDLAYGEFKKASSKNVVMGGNTFSWGSIRPGQWVKNMRFGSNNQRPRLDLYAHNPFSNRKPNLSNPPFCGTQAAGCADFSDLRWFGKLVDANLGWSGHRHLPLFLSEYCVPTAPNDLEFPYYVSPPVQASWVKAAFNVARAVGAHTFGWVHLADDPPKPSGRTSHCGLLNYNGAKKPAYFAFKNQP